VTAIEAGGDDFLAKTVPPAVLEAKMKAMARIASLRQRLSVANRKLEELASCDGLTGLCNRRSMDLRFDAAWVDMVKEGRSFGLLMVDVDNFKNFNDRYGHLAGDDCLRAVAQALGAVVEACDCGEAFAARYGGEEFAVVLPGMDEGGYRALAATILEAVRARAIPHVENGAWGLVTVSIGGAWLDRAQGEILGLFRTADARLYQAKAAGRNRAEFS
jgi:diguanylate cyclase (GGDEF)-like protein